MSPYDWMFAGLASAGRDEVADEISELLRNPGLGALWASEVEEGKLKMAVAALSSPQPVDFIGEWAFGSTPDSVSPEATLRLALWEGARLRRSMPVVLLPWIFGRFAQFPLGDDFTRCLFVSGLYEPNEVSIACALAKPGSVAIDVGANRGLFSLALSACVGNDGQVIAIEASRREGDALVENISNNDLSNVDVVRAAAGARGGVASITEASEDHPGTGRLVAGGQGSHDVAVVTLDSLTDKCRDRVSLVKLDVEGSELGVLVGAEHLLQRDRPALVLEVNEAALNEQGATQTEVLSFLRDLDYQLYALDAATGYLVEGGLGTTSVVALACGAMETPLAGRVQV